MDIADFEMRENSLGDHELHRLLCETTGQEPTASEVAEYRCWYFGS